MSVMPYRFIFRQSVFRDTPSSLAESERLPPFFSSTARIASASATWSGVLTGASGSRSLVSFTRWGRKRPMSSGCMI